MTYVAVRRVPTNGHDPWIPPDVHVLTSKLSVGKLVEELLEEEMASSEIRDEARHWLSVWMSKKTPEPCLLEYLDLALYQR